MDRRTRILGQSDEIEKMGMWGDKRRNETPHVTTYGTQIVVGNIRPVYDCM